MRFTLVTGFTLGLAAGFALGFVTLAMAPRQMGQAGYRIADARLGEKVCLAVLPSGQEAPGADDVLAHLDKGGLSKYDMPEYFLAMPAFPLTASGKILKRELIEMAKRGDIEPTPVRFARSDD